MNGRFDHETADSPISGDETAKEAYAPSPKKSRRGANKRVVIVPIGDGDGSGSKIEVHPPPDSWSWRKYGQKPIKGSPYPRGYYRCSSSKGCPARKQVERSRLDPTTLLITYSCNHNHPLPTTTKGHRHQAAAASLAAKSATSSSSDTTGSPAEYSVTFSCQPDMEELCPADNGCLELAGEFGWPCNVGPTIMDVTTLVVPTWRSQGADVEFSVPIGEEDKLLFGDLGDLPDSSMVFQRYRVEAPCCASTG